MGDDARIALDETPRENNTLEPFELDCPTVSDPEVKFRSLSW